MKVLIGPNNVANQAYYLAKYLRAYGVDATCMVYRAANRFNYDADWVVRLDAEYLEREGLTANQVYRRTLHEAFERQFDIYHFYQSSLIPAGLPISHNLTKGLDIPLIRLRGGRVIYRFTGWEIRNRELDLERNPYSPFKHGSKGTPDPENRDRYVNFLRQHVDAFVVTDPQMREGIPEASIIPRLLNLADFPEIGIERPKRPLVVHAPSNRNAKGSDFILKALEECRNRGADFDLQLVENMPFAEALEYYKRADLVIDQVLIGWHGVLTIECMAMGKPVAVYVRDDLLRDSPYADIPIVNINLDNVADKLFEAITSPDLRRSLSMRARAYVAQHHDVPAVIPKVMSLYKAALASEKTPTGSDDVAYVLQYRDELLRLRDRNAPAVNAETPGNPLPGALVKVARGIGRVGRAARQTVKLAGLSALLPHELKLQTRLNNMVRANEDLKKWNASLRALHAGWVSFMSTSAMFAENAGRALQQHGFRPDVTIAHDVTTLEALRTMQREFGSRAILDAIEFTEVRERTGNIFRSYPPEGLEILQTRIDHLIREVEDVVTVGPSIAKALAARHGREITVVSNSRAASPYERSTAVRERIGAAETDIVCAFPNLIADGYGFEAVVEAIRRLPGEFKLVHIGQVAVLGGYKGIVEKVVNDPALNGRVKSLGEVPYDAVPGLLSGTDLGIICLAPESQNARLAFPNRFHDLVAAGVPIMTSPIEDVQRPVLDRGLGAVFDAIEPDRIVETLQANRPRLEEYRSNVIAYRKAHTWESEFEKLLALIGDRRRICMLVKKNITNHGRTHRIVASLIDAGKEVCVVAPTGKLPKQSDRLSTVLVQDGLLNKG